MKIKIIKSYIFGFLILLLAVLSLSSCKKKTDEEIEPTPGPDIPPVIDVTNIHLTHGKTTLFIGETSEFTFSFTPNDANQEYVITYSNEELGEVKNNTFVAKAAGDIEVSVSSKNYPAISQTVKYTILPDLAQEKYEVKYIATGAGEDASTEATINYHAYNKKTYLEYTTSDDPTFINKKVVYSEPYYFCELDPVLATPFEERYVCRTTLSGLSPNTNYIYRINQGDDTYSETYTFKTALGTGGMSFLLLCDIHYWAKADGTSHGSEISETTINNALKIDPSINLVVDAGDTVDTGGDEDTWNVMYQNRLSLKSLLYAGVPGNHEYYVNGTGQWDNRFFKAFMPSNLNGHEGKIGSSYYFVYNDCLFIMLDNAKKTGYSYQMIWLENLLRTTTAKYVVVNMHIPINAGSGSANATDSDPKLMTLFEKYGVDLVLAGHYHGENYSTAFDGGSATEDAGVVYFRGAAAGIKSAGTDVLGSIRGQIINITDDGHFTINVINGNGESIRKYEFDTKKYTDSTPTEKQEIIDSLKYSIDTTTKKIHFEWTPSAYGTLKSITFSEKMRNEISREVIIISKGYYQTTLDSDMLGYDYDFEVTFEFIDGLEMTTICPIKTEIVAGATFTDITSNSAKVEFTKADDKFKYMIEFYDLYLNGDLIKRVSYETLNYNLNNLQSNTDYSFQYRAIGYYGEVIFTKEYLFKTK